MQIQVCQLLAELVWMISCGMNPTEQIDLNDYVSFHKGSEWFEHYPSETVEATIVADISGYVSGKFQIQKESNQEMYQKVISDSIQEAIDRKEKENGNK